MILLYINDKLLFSLKIITMNWNDTCNRFVAFFDIMGFKENVRRNSHHKILSKMRKLTTIIEPIEYEFKRSYYKNSTQKKSVIAPPIKPVVFSDSVLFISSGDTEDDIIEMIINAGWLMGSCFEKKIPIKGAISFGKFTADFEHSIYFGQPLIDAYELQNELLLYGCIVDHTIESYLHRKNMLEVFYDSGLKKMSVPLKSGRVNHYLLDWFHASRHHGSRKKQVDSFYKTVSGKPRIYVDNTMEYIQQFIEINSKKD